MHGCWLGGGQRRPRGPALCHREALRFAMRQPLLFPLDGSDHAEAVLPWAVRLARVRDWQIYLVQAARLPTLPSSGMLGEEMSPELYEQILNAETEGATAYLNEVRQRLIGEVPDIQIVVRA